MKYQRLTDVIHTAIDGYLQQGNYAIDTTAGNGFDTLFLAQKVGVSGGVLAFDIQKKAIEHTAAKLLENNMLERVRLVQDSHEKLIDYLPKDWVGKVKAVMFNLGYLPGSDKTIITQPSSTLKALEASQACLQVGGVMSLIIYTGHTGGMLEYQAVEKWLGGLDKALYSIDWLEHHPIGGPKPSAVMIRKVFQQFV